MIEMMGQGADESMVTVRSIAFALVKRKQFQSFGLCVLLATERPHFQRQGL
jgi:hypothetical protein